MGLIPTHEYYGGWGGGGHKSISMGQLYMMLCLVLLLIMGGGQKFILWRMLLDGGSKGEGEGERWILSP